VGKVAMRYEIVILLILLISAVGLVLSFFIGKKRGMFQGEQNYRLTLKSLEKKVRALESKNENLQTEMETLNRKAEKYLQFLVRLPDAVKQINSNLSFDGLITALMRLTKDLTGTEVIEVYMFNGILKHLHLVAAHGTHRGKTVEVVLGEGLIGKAAEMKTIISRNHPGIKLFEADQAGIETVAPIVFSDSLLGAIAVGEMKGSTGNEKRFLAMLADLLAVAINNIRTLEIANEEAITDALTGLFNKRYFFEKALEMLHTSASYDSPFSIFIFDIDHFKNYNDTNGHMQGDIVLKEIGRLLRENTRSTNVAARYGGEEFVVLLQDTGKQAAMMCAENIRRLIEAQPFSFREKQPLGCVSISGGVATFPLDGDTAEEIIKHADEALYAAKVSGRNCVMKYEPELLS
jgi:diguanylate cyclase (GGDEF)-like protein